MKSAIQNHCVTSPILLLLTAGFVLLMAGCSSSSTDAPAPPDPPDITTISPTEGPVGTAVTIEGSGFSQVASENRVTFNGA
ncbi:MAG: IPT/TIG domain-containing protein, partial [Balneolaceae bacterium]